MNSDPAASVRTSRGKSREVESLFWLAAAAAWVIVALKAWSRSKKQNARRKAFATSERLLREVFPYGIRS